MSAVHVDAADAILRHVDAHRDAAERFLAALVRVPSDNPPGDCDPHAAAAAGMLESLGFTVERHPVPEAEVKANGMVSCTNLIVRERFGDGPVVACNAHGDVVPPGAGWSVDPYAAVVRDGTMYGRGVAVSKSDFATYAFALLALKASGARRGGSVELHLTYDEEVGGAIGPPWILARGLSKPDFAISAGFAYGITIAHNGVLHVEVEVLGRSAHAAMPETGVDALEAATSVLAAIYAHRRELAQVRSGTPGIGSPGITVGLIHGGINTNVVPDRIVFRIDRRIVPEEDPSEAERALGELIRSAAARHPGIECRVRRIMLATPFVPRPGHERLVAAIGRGARRVLGEDIETRGVPLYTDARHYSAAGIPTVLYGAGPRTLLEANGHCADEKLVLDDLNKATKVVALALLDLLGR